jgi:hypothetical protein
LHSNIHKELTSSLSILTDENQINIHKLLKLLNDININTKYNKFINIITNYNQDLMNAIDGDIDSNRDILDALSYLEKQMVALIDGERMVFNDRCQDRTSGGDSDSDEDNDFDNDSNNDSKIDNNIDNNIDIDINNINEDFLFNSQVINIQVITTLLSKIKENNKNISCKIDKLKQITKKELDQLNKKNYNNYLSIKKSKINDKKMLLETLTEKYNVIVNSIDTLQIGKFL